MKSAYVHEMALRLIMHALATSAARYGRDVRPLLSCSIDFYVRIFVQVVDSAASAKRQASRTGIVIQCVQCESFFVQHFGEVEETQKATKFKAAKCAVPGSECPECKGRLKLGGPFYMGPLYDPDFCGHCLEACEASDERHRGITSWKKIQGLLTAISEESLDIPLFYRLPQLCKGLKLPPVPLRQFRGTLKSLGYRVSHFHREPEAIKTDAPNEVVYDLMRLWAQEHPPKTNPLPEVLKKSVGLKRPVEWKVEESEQRANKVARFLPNPEPNWGPKARAKGTKADAVVKDAAEAAGPPEAAPEA